MSDIAYYTVEGLKKVRDELGQLEHVERPRVTKEIADARDKGDLSENAEYHAAKEEQSLLEFKIAQMKNELSKARLID
ncbi:MAG: transcription elongation factor GreA, partial [Flavobacteriaceae bacterium]|nr:transcription elongation factor GreA [Flavobacteriaceae bacterium]